MTARERMFARNKSAKANGWKAQIRPMPASFRRESRNSLLESHSPRRCPRPERLLDPERCAVMAIVEHEACMTAFENVAATESEVRSTVFCGDNCESQQVYAATPTTKKRTTTATTTPTPKTMTKVRRVKTVKSTTTRKTTKMTTISMTTSTRNWKGTTTRAMTKRKRATIRRMNS